MDASGTALADRVRATLDASARQIARVWLEKILARLPESPDRVFPEATLLNHIPALLKRLAAAASGGDPCSEPEVRDELYLLARLRRSQGYGVREVVHEFDELGEIVAKVIEKECIRHPSRDGQVKDSLADAFEVSRRLQRALDGMSAVTTEAFETEATDDRLERAELLNAFGRTVSHELRNRLNAASLAVEVCGTVLHDHPKGLEALERVRRQITKVASVVSDVFAVAVARGYADPADGKAEPLSDVINAAVEDFADYARANDVKIEIAEPVPKFVVDTSRVQLILVNLVSNAIKYADEGRPERLVRISASRHEQARRWIVCVADNGIGIPIGERQHVFERNHRGQQAAATADGHGIGLTLARQAIAQLKGNIWIDDGIDGGTAVCFSLTEPTHGLPQTDSSQR